MRLLLDTCTLLWCTIDQSRLSPSAERVLQDESNVLLVSFVSAWEIHVKAGLGKLELPEDASTYLRNSVHDLRLTPLPLEWGDLVPYPKLEGDHRDPFDRLLACQAMARNVDLVTPDARLKELGANVLW